MTAAIHNAIAIRAYHIWEGEGRPHGRHEHHWFAAEAAERHQAIEVRTAAPVAVEAAPAPAPAKKAVAAKKPAAPAKAPACKAAPKAPAEAVVAAAALKAPRASRPAAKASRISH